MPRGSYQIVDEASGSRAVERFSCAVGAAGWRYAGEVVDADGRGLGTVDLTCDSRWRVARLEVRAGNWLLRAGAVGRELVWTRVAAESRSGPRSGSRSGSRSGARSGSADERSTTAAVVAGRSPAFLVAAAGVLDLDVGGSGRVRCLLVTGPALATRSLDQDWTLVEVTEHRGGGAPHRGGGTPLRVEHYALTDLDTGDRRDVHLAGDVLLAAPGVELTELHSPPDQNVRRPRLPP